MKQITYQELGGLRKGKSATWAMNASWPFAKITVSRENITISPVTFMAKFFFQKFILKRNEVSAVQSVNGYLGPLGRGVKIYHKKKNLSPFVLFWSVSRDKLLKELKKRGYILKKPTKLSKL